MNWRLYLPIPVGEVIEGETSSNHHLHTPDSESVEGDDQFS